MQGPRLSAARAARAAARTRAKRSPAAIFRSLFSSSESRAHTGASVTSLRVDRDTHSSFRVDAPLDVDDFLHQTHMSLDEGYSYVRERTSACRLDGYYPEYFYEDKSPLIRCELAIDHKRPPHKRRFVAASPGTSSAGSAFSSPASGSTPVKLLRQLTSGFGAERLSV